ncbi:MAG: discoidin domain-containing protein [Phycisphaerae bacterium]|nr:discoidin domain-containing protein [Phycisphaerae bacterium]
MERKQLVVWYWAAAVVLALGYTAAAGPVGLVGHWTFDEGQGAIAHDSSGNGLDGTLRGNPTWVTGGQVGGALDFNGSTAYVEIPNNSLLSLTTEITIAAWTNMRTTASGEMAILSKGSWAANNLPYEVTEDAGGVIYWQFYNDAGRDTCSPTSPSVGEWHHIAATYDGKVFKCYIDGALGEEWAYVGTMPKNTASVTIGRRSGGGTYFNGMIDDVQLWARALSAAEIAKIMPGLADASIAQDPDPEDQAADVPCDTVLSWKAGETAAAHDVYLGKTFADVNEAGRAVPRGVLASQDQAATTYDPEGLLEYGRTYYWRIDEVNGAPDSTIFKGQTWSFTTELFGYPITGVTATASSYQTDMGPQNTVNGSGLDGIDQHSTESKDMWLTTGAKPAWIQYEFATAYKLHEMWVWNSNQLVESFLGFGAKNVTIEYSSDGQAWTRLGGVPQFAKATGLPTYTANTTVTFGGVTAKYVKLTIDGNWGGMAPQTGLSEVRFFYVPVQAFGPQPAAATTGVSVETELDWRPGREATSHTVYLGTDRNAVADGTAGAKTVADHGYSPASLTFATEYFWKVDEVGATGTYSGNVWSFTTEEFAPIDGFESYNDEDDRIYDTWIDGMTNGASGSTVGHIQAPFAEKAIVHGGRQSMPLTYDNTASPFYSEAERTFDTPQNWTAHGADTLSVYFQGVAPAAGSSGQGLYVTVKDSSGKSKTVAHPDAAAAAKTGWQQWKIPLSEFTSAGVKMNAVKMMTIGVGNRASPTKGGTGILYIDDIAYGRSFP